MVVWRMKRNDKEFPHNFPPKIVRSGFTVVEYFAVEIRVFGMYNEGCGIMLFFGNRFTTVLITPFCN